MNTAPTLAALALLTAMAGCFVPVPIRGRHDGRSESWNDRDDWRGRDDSRDRSDRRDHDPDRDGKRCWDQDGRRYCR